VSGEMQMSRFIIYAIYLKLFGQLQLLRIRLMGHVVCMVEVRSVYKILVGKS
jgi:hypothetical protein